MLEVLKLQVQIVPSKLPVSQFVSVTYRLPEKKDGLLLTSSVMAKKSLRVVASVT